MKIGSVGKRKLKNVSYSAMKTFFFFFFGKRAFLFHVGNKKSKRNLKSICLSNVCVFWENFRYNMCVIEMSLPAPLSGRVRMQSHDLWGVDLMTCCSRCLHDCRDRISEALDVLCNIFILEHVVPGFLLVCRN